MKRRRLLQLLAGAVLCYGLAQPEPGRGAVPGRLLTPTHVCVVDWRSAGYGAGVTGFLCWPRQWRPRSPFSPSPRAS
jgi:hypothetical protein